MQNIASGVTPLQRGPTCQRKRGLTQDAPEDKENIPQINHPAEDQAETLPGGVGRPPGSAELGLAPVQVHFEE